MAEKIIITPTQRSFFGRAELKEVSAYRDLLFLLVKRDITTKYKQSVLGIFWAILRPVITMFIFAFIFGKFAKINPGNNIPYALFSLAALVPWYYFSSAFTSSTSSLITNQGILTKVYFPRVIIPLVPVLSGLLDMFIGLVILFIFLFCYKVPLTINISFLPLLILILIVFVAGTGFWLSAVAIQYRDVQVFSGFLVQILMYLSPIIFPLQYIPQKYIMIYSAYPMVGIIEGFRSAMIGKTPMPWQLIGMAAAVSLFIFCTGLLFFNRRQKIFADVV